MKLIHFKYNNLTIDHHLNGFEKDFRKAKELIAQENKDFNKKYKEIKLNLTKKKVDPRKADVKAEAPSEAKPESKPEEPKQEEVKKQLKD